VNQNKAVDYHRRMYLHQVRVATQYEMEMEGVKPNNNVAYKNAKEKRKEAGERANFHLTFIMPKEREKLLQEAEDVRQETLYGPKPTLKNDVEGLGKTLSEGASRLSSSVSSAAKKARRYIFGK